MTATGDTLVVIVNYRTPALVIDCLRSLAGEVAAHPATRVVVVDNASGDGSFGAITAAIAGRGWGGWARAVAAPVNGGFAYGNNLAIRPTLAGDAAPAFVWLLNPDTRVRPGALAAFAAFFAAHPRAGIAGSLIEDADGAPWPYAFRFPSILGEFERGVRLSLVTRLLDDHRVLRRMSDVPAAADWVSGASMMVRREVFDTIGPMDDDYFLYFEETDFCLAARRAGWACWYVPDARIMHIAGQSTGVTGSAEGRNRLPAYWFDSRRRYFVKNHGRAYAAAADIVWLLAFLVWTARRLVQRRAGVDPPHLVRDFLAGSALFRSLRPASPRGALSGVD